MNEEEASVANCLQNPYPNGTYTPHLTALSPNADMTCVWLRDSPGDLHGAGLNSTDPNSQMLYLMALLDDACLQVRARTFARDYGYAIVGAIVAFALASRGQKLALFSRSTRQILHTLRHLLTTAFRKRSASKNGLEAVWKSNGLYPRVAGVFRFVTYRQMTPTRMQKWFKVPNFGVIIAITVYMGLVILMSFIHADTHDDQRWQSWAVQASWVSMAQFPLIGKTCELAIPSSLSLIMHQLLWPTRRTLLGCSPASHTNVLMCFIDGPPEVFWSLRLSTLDYRAMVGTGLG